MWSRTSTPMMARVSALVLVFCLRFSCTYAMMVVESNHQGIPTSMNPGGAVSPFLSRFSSLGDLCTFYPYGLGYECLPDGQLGFRLLPSLMIRGPPSSAYLRSQCQYSRHCAQLGPDDPDRTTPERPACVADVGQDVVGPVSVRPSAPQCTAPTFLTQEDYTPDYEDRYWCDEFWLGEPVYQDCLRALDEFDTFEDDEDESSTAAFRGIGERASYKALYG